MVSPDVGSVKRTRKVAEMFGAPMAIIDKRRYKQKHDRNYDGNRQCARKNLLLIDDMIDTAGTMTNSIKELKNLGANDIYAAANLWCIIGESHPKFVRGLRKCSLPIPFICQKKKKSKK